MILAPSRLEALEHEITDQGEQEVGVSDGVSEEVPPSASSNERIAACASLSDLAGLESEWFAMRAGHDDAEQIDGMFDAARYFEAAGSGVTEPNPLQSDTCTRILIATNLLVIILWLALGGHALWTGTPFP